MATMKIALRMHGALTAVKAVELGYDGVEIRDGDAIPAGVKIACISTDIVTTGHTRADRLAAVEVRRCIDEAGAIGCDLIKILDTSAKGDRAASATRMGRWLTPLGDYAAEHGVGIVVENRLTFRRAGDLWLMLETTNHPAVAAAWDFRTALAAGESFAVSIPALNTRIEYVTVHWPDNDERSTLERFFHRLQGVGFHGWAAVHAGTEQGAAEAIVKLREWGKPHRASSAGRVHAK